MTALSCGIKDVTRQARHARDEAAHLHLRGHVACRARRELLERAVPAAWVAEIGVPDRERCQGFDIRLSDRGSRQREKPWQSWT